MTLNIALFGATGACGRHALRELLADAKVSHVDELGRRVTDNLSHSKLAQTTVDFEKISQAGLQEKRYDVVVIAMGTTKANAGSFERFVKIDREYVLAAAQAARVEGMKQRLVYISAFGARSDSWLPYAKSKGLTEEGLAKLGYETIIMRPGFLIQRGGTETRVLEATFRLFTGAMSYFTPKMEIKTADVGKATRIAATFGVSGIPSVAEVFTAGGANDVPLYHVVGNKGQIALAKENL